MPKLRPALINSAVPALVFVLLFSIMLLRLNRQPMQPYGTDAAHYIEHTARLDLVWTLAKVDFGPHGGDTLRSLIEDLDGSFPPLMHLITAAAGGIGSHSAHGVQWTGLVWLFLLAVALAGIARILSGSSSIAAASCCAVGLLPAAHASATRYYYDLPMTTLLWLMVLAMLALRQRVLLAPLLAGALFFAACITKWTALPFGLLMLAGASLCPIDSDTGTAISCLRKQLTTALATAVLAAIAVVVFLDLAGNHDSFTAMLGDIGERGEIWGPKGVDTGRLSAISDHILRDLQPLSPQRLRFYGVRIITSVFSPGLLIVLLVLTAAWALRSRRGWPLIAFTIVGQGAFLLLRIPPTDERFVLTLAPALTLAAALGWGSLPTRARIPVGVLFITLAFAVAADFHLAPRDAESGPKRAIGEENLSDLMLWGLNDSSDQRGWARYDQQRDNRDEQREALWRQISACNADVLKVASERSLVSERGARGDLYWLRYRSRLSELQEGGQRQRVLLSCDEANEDESQLALSAVRPGAEPRRPRCIRASAWQLEGLISVNPGNHQVALWSPNGKRICHGLK